MTLRVVNDPPTLAERLRRLLLDNHADGSDPHNPLAACEFEPSNVAGLVRHDVAGWWCDPGWDRHGLTWWYPKAVQLLGIRSTTGRRGAGGAVAVPMDLSALDFLTGKYWVLEETPTDATIDDPDSYRSGFVPTVIGLERSARVALRLQPRHRERAQGYDGLGFDDRVPAALAWLAVHAEQLVDEAPLLADTIRNEALRLIGRATAMVMGHKFAGTVNDCMHCVQPTVIADEDRAVCINPECRREDGSRHCWRFDEEADTWVDVDEPNVGDRGRVTDEQMSRWVSATG